MEAREPQGVWRIWLRVPAGLAWGLMWGAGEEMGPQSHFPLLSLRPPPMALNKQKGTLYNTKYTGKSFPPRLPPTRALDFAEWEGQLWRKGLGPPASDAVPGPFPRSWDGGR